MRVGDGAKLMVLVSASAGQVGVAGGGGVGVWGEGVEGRADVGGGMRVRGGAKLMMLVSANAGQVGLAGGGGVVRGGMCLHAIQLLAAVVMVVVVGGGVVVVVVVVKALAAWQPGSKAERRAGAGGRTACVCGWRAA